MSTFQDSIALPTFDRSFFERCCETSNFFSHTHRMIVLMMEAGKLVPGGLYLVNDYRTSYTQPVTNDNKHALPERLVVIATSIQSVSDKAYSIDFPDDEIEYDIMRQETLNQEYCTGTITYRKTSNGNSAYYDHRTVLFARWEDSAIPAYATAIADNGNLRKEYLTFRDDVAYTNHCAILGSRSDMPLLPNNVLLNSNYCIVGDGAQNCTILNTLSSSIDTAAKGSIILFALNSYIGKGSTNCKIVNLGSGFDVSKNVHIGDFCTNVSIVGKCVDVSIGDNSTNSTINTTEIATVGSNANTVLLFGNNNNTVIGSNATNVFAIASATLNIGNNARDIVLQGANVINIGDNGNDIQCVGLYYTTVGHNVNRIYLGDTDSGDIVGYINVYNDCSDVRVASSNCIVNEHCSFVEIYEGADNSIVEAYNSNVKIDIDCEGSRIGTNNDNVIIEINSKNNKIGNNNYAITISTNCDDNTIGDNNAEVDLFYGCSNNKVQNYCFEVAIGNGSNNLLESNALLVTLFLSTNPGDEVNDNIIKQRCLFSNIKSSANYIGENNNSINIEAYCMGNKTGLLCYNVTFEYLNLYDQCTRNEVYNYSNNVRLSSSANCFIGSGNEDTALQNVNDTVIGIKNKKLTLINSASVIIKDFNEHLILEDANNTKIGSKNIYCNFYDSGNTLGDDCMYVEFKKGLTAPNELNNVTNAAFVDIFGIGNTVHFSSSVSVGVSQTYTIQPFGNIVMHSSNIIFRDNNFKNEVYNSNSVDFADEWSQNILNQCTSVIIPSANTIGYLNTFNQCLDVQTSAMQLVRVVLDNVQNTNLPVTVGAVSGLSIYGNVFQTKVATGNDSVLGRINYQTIFHNGTPEYTVIP